jgi:hypothetical protein
VLTATVISVDTRVSLWRGMQRPSDQGGQPITNCVSPDSETPLAQDLFKEGSILFMASTNQDCRKRRVSKRSAYGLDSLNFLMADVRDGLIWRKDWSHWQPDWERV